MATSFTLRRSIDGAKLTPSTVGGALAKLGRGRRTSDEAALRAHLVGYVVRVTATLEPDDDAAVAFPLEFLGQGARVVATAHGPSVAALSWLIAGVAAELQADLEGPDPAGVEARNAHRLDDGTADASAAAAMAYVLRYEAAVGRDRESGDGGQRGARFVAWLAEEGLIALDGDASTVADAVGQTLPFDDASALYEALFEHADVAEVFASEREIEFALTRFRARFAHARD
jgi:hypothetical protein